MGEAEDVVEVVGHRAELAVDEVEGGDEIRSRDTHESLDNSHLFLATAACDDVAIEAVDERSIGLVALLKIIDDSVSIDAEREHQESGTPACAILALRAMP